MTEPEQLALELDEPADDPEEWSFDRWFRNLPKTPYDTQEEDAPQSAPTP